MLCGSDCKFFSACFSFYSKLQKSLRAKFGAYFTPPKVGSKRELKHYEFRQWENENTANEILFAITDGDMAQIAEWDKLEVHDFFAKLEAHRNHQKKKMPKESENKEKYRIQKDK